MAPLLPAHAALPPSSAGLRFARSVASRQRRLRLLCLRFARSPTGWAPTGSAILFVGAHPVRDRKRRSVSRCATALAARLCLRFARSVAARQRRLRRLCLRFARSVASRQRRLRRLCLRFARSVASRQRRLRLLCLRFARSPTGWAPTKSAVALTCRSPPCGRPAGAIIDADTRTPPRRNAPNFTSSRRDNMPTDAG